MHEQFVGIDWGTSNRRAYLIDRHGACLARHEDGQGMLAVQGRFAESLAALLAEMRVGAGVPVLMSGMVGSASGWREVPYLDTGVPLVELPAHLLRVDGHGLARDCFIVPGYCQREGGVDVMRGEETQLLGALALDRRDGWLVLPGTHSKWVLLRDGAIVRLATFMTGELFATLAAQGTLAPLMAQGDEDDAAFDAGVLEARLGAPLTNSLFRVRARVVSGAMPAAQARGFVSGLLIGTEFVAASAADAAGEADAASADGAAGGADASNAACTGAAASICLIASNTLQQRYARAAGLLGFEASALDPHLTYIAALTHFFAKATA